MWAKAVGVDDAMTCLAEEGTRGTGEMRDVKGEDWRRRWFD